MIKKKPSYFYILCTTVILVGIYSFKVNAMTCTDLMTVGTGVNHISQFENETTAQLTKQYYTFREGFRIRYDEFYKKLKPDTSGGDREQQRQARSQAIQRLYREENATIDAIRVSLAFRPAHERLEYLRGLSRENLVLHAEILDYLFGLRIQEMDANLREELESTKGLDGSKLREKYGDEEIWYAPGGGQQSPWAQLLNVVDAMNLKSGHLVSDLGSGVGRLGLLLGLLRPDVNFVGLELVGERVKYANQAVEALGFSNVKFAVANLSDSNLTLPQADHIYMFNPTNERTSEIVTEKLVHLSQTKKYRVYLLTSLRSNSFLRFFKMISSRNVGIYERSVP